MNSHGGARPNTGPKTKLARQVKDSEEAIAELQDMVRGGLRVAADAFPQLIEAELELAHDGGSTLEGMKLAQKSRQFLIKTVLDSVPTTDLEDNPLARMFAGWRLKEATIERVDGPDQGPVVDSECRVIS